jgi:hypothetical protein
MRSESVALAVILAICITHTQGNIEVLAGIHHVYSPQFADSVSEILPHMCTGCTKHRFIANRLQRYSALCRLGGVLVSVLATGPKGRVFEPGLGGGFLRAIKISSTPSFGWEVKPDVPCRKILRHVKDLLKSQENG